VGRTKRNDRTRGGFYGIHVMSLVSMFVFCIEYYLYLTSTRIS
jgi:hypothetical protein